MTEQQFNDYKSKYLDITVGFIEPPITPSVVAEDPVPYGNNQGLEDIDFCLELLLRISASLIIVSMIC